MSSGEEPFDFPSALVGSVIMILLLIFVYMALGTYHGSAYNDGFYDCKRGDSNQEMEVKYNE